VIRPKAYCVNRYLRLFIERYLHIYFCETFDLEKIWDLSFETWRNDLNPFIEDLRFDFPVTENH